MTTNEVPGYRITQVRGMVFGLIVRARNAFSEIGDIMSEVAAYGTAVTVEPTHPPLPRTDPDGERISQGRHSQVQSLFGDADATGS